MNQFDIFGSQVSVRFKGSQIYKTKFGAFVSALIFAVILLRLGILVHSVVQGRNPTVLFQERPVQDPRKFSITPDTLSLAIGLQDTHFNYYADNSLFTIQGVHKIKKTVYNSTTGQYDQIYTSNKFNLVNCTDDNVPDPQLRDFFLKSQLYQHQCIPKDLIVGIEGQFNSDFYQELNFYFYKCKGQGCKSDKEINTLLNNNYVELLFTDVNFAPENKENPFQKFSRDLYWINSQNLPRNVNVYMRNNYVESDFGWVTPDVETQIYPSFSYVDNQIADSSIGFFFHLVIRFEKEKENLYKRTYDNLFTIMSQIGGFSQILLTVFSFICLKYSQIHLGRSLINQSFDFQDISKEPNQGTLISNPTQQQNNTEMAENQVYQNQNNNKLFNQSPPMKESSFQLQTSQKTPDQLYQSKEDKISLVQQAQINPLDDTQQQQQINQRNNQNIGKQLADDVIMKDYQKQQEVQQNRQSLHFNVFFYMLSFITTIFKRFRNKKQVIDYGFKEISNNLDIEYIVKKFIEVDKLKRIILSNDQLTLFNYIPRPQILYKEDKTQGVIIEKNSFFNNDDNLSDIDKFKKAKQCFKNIAEKQKPTKIDISILNLLDDKQYEILSSKLDKKQFLQRQQSILKELQAMQPVSPSYNLSQGMTTKFALKHPNSEEGVCDSIEDCFDSGKIKKYSTFKKVRNPSMYSTISDQEKIVNYSQKDSIDEKY
ncbi:transmembrane protein, putative (macronuclear) [Tetrahymena thermophila SB210]|uniref:Transmembrane protein, putative n=1 Tax=Tetrahymena thermophila (strain SB210) TaxID=312017 RepID=W7WZD2_TETTS|nr:transmembrane protein, putative [Tetrahymena thermophila SB210]EWS72255.1 transmembrane protein, putative [Tetrahymena thermophila SB210]|eukprot:XP_012655195.1 transmembrane protein, putative [Tetrahymena thermophila SB210]